MFTFAVMKKIPLCSFYPIHPSQAMPMDVVSTESFRDFLYENPAYRTNYFSIYLITEGEEMLEVNGVKDMVQPGVIVTSRPGEMWVWQQRTHLEGSYLYFTKEFICSFFNDSQFLDHFSFFRNGRSTSFFHLDKERFLHLLDLQKRMEKEVTGGIGDQHVLRAMVYEVLALLEREVNMASSAQPKEAFARKIPTRGEEYYISQFQQLASTYFITEHQVEFYASRLFITSNYLNKIVRQSLGKSTKQYLAEMLMNESKRLLSYTSLSVNEIAKELHLEPAYFVKWFRQGNGVTPLQYRKGG